MPARLSRLYNQLSSGTAATRQGPGVGPQREATGPFVYSKVEDTVQKKGRRSAPAVEQRARRSQAQYWQRRVGSRWKERPTSVSPRRRPPRSSLLGVRGQPVSGRVRARTTATPHSTVRLSSSRGPTILWTPCKRGIRGPFAALGINTAPSTSSVQGGG